MELGAVLEAVEGHGAAAEAAERALLRYNEEVTGWGGEKEGAGWFPLPRPGALPTGAAVSLCFSTVRAA